ncbi:DUF1573 domain-containing protein [Taibaiella soli]|uniref:DUF1573 domain-containing protein n=1 Tax=Taibaiella soli TaxID=1649169 RepID=A0A2W2AAR6_9BACT|nr:DUF1573 domain-containing protein [Taibaiella soli]PZF72371.1 DUF1573 domain-containing protein [Taibaiella soli]
MKKLVTTFLSLSLFAFGARAQAPGKENPNAPKFQFKEVSYDFGKLKEGVTVQHVFKFKNTGKEPLIIQYASDACACASHEWPKEPILPGKTGEIIITYHTKGRPGPFSKVVYIQSNAVTDQPRLELHTKVASFPIDS